MFFGVLPPAWQALHPPVWDLLQRPTTRCARPEARVDARTTTLSAAIVVGNTVVWLIHPLKVEYFIDEPHHDRASQRDEQFCEATSKRLGKLPSPFSSGTRRSGDE